MQTCKSAFGLCKSAKVEYESMEYGVSSIGRGIETGDGHGHREFRRRPFGHRELAPGFRRLKAEGLMPERLTTGAVTRHLE